MKTVLLKKSGNISLKEKGILLEKMDKDSFTEEELFDLADDYYTLSYIINNGYTKIIRYITNPAYLLMELKNKKSIIEMFLEDSIINKDALPIIKLYLDSYNTIPFSKIAFREDKKLNHNSFNLTVFINFLIENNYITKEDAFNIILNNKSIYSSAIVQGEIIIRRYLYIKDNYDEDSIATNFLLKQKENSELTNLDYLIKCGLDGLVVERELDNNIPIVKKYLELNLFTPLLTYCNNDILTCDILGENKSILDYAYDYYEKNIESDDIILTLPFNQDVLLSKSLRDDETYIDRVISILSNVSCLDDFCLNYIHPSIYMHKSKYLDNKSLLEYLIERDLLEYIVNSSLIDTSFWLYEISKDYTMLDYLVKINKDLVLFKVINNDDLMCDPKIVLQVNKYLEEKEKVYPTHSEYEFNALKSKAIKKNCELLLEGDITEEQKQKIEFFRDFMMRDKKSSKEAIDLACNAFKILYINDFPYTDRDLENTIKIKLNDEKFCIKYDKDIDRSCFDTATHAIILSEKSNVYTFNHELAHAHHFAYFNNHFAFPVIFYYYLVPSFLMLSEKKLETIKTVVKNNNEIFEQYLEEKLKNLVEEEDIKLMFKDFQNHLNKTINDEEVVKSITSYESYSSNLFKKLGKAIIDTVYLTSPIIDDFLDAVYEGYLLDNGLEIDGEIIGMSGHGSKAFNNPNRSLALNITVRFTEMFADYVEAIKSPFCDEILEKLELLFGETYLELFNYFYKNLTISPEIEIDFNPTQKLKRLSLN